MLKAIKGQKRQIKKRQTLSFYGSTQKKTGLYHITDLNTIKDLWILSLCELFWVAIFRLAVELSGDYISDRQARPVDRSKQTHFHKSTSNAWWHCSVNGWSHVNCTILLDWGQRNCNIVWLWQHVACSKQHATVLKSLSRVLNHFKSLENCERSRWIAAETRSLKL